MDSGLSIDMEHQEKFFVRSEALQILAGIMSKPHMPKMLAIYEAIATAQAFEEQMQQLGLGSGLNSVEPLFKTVYGGYVASGNLVYFQSNDGSRMLIGSVQDMPAAVGICLGWNLSLYGDRQRVDVEVLE